MIQVDQKIILYLNFKIDISGQLFDYSNNEIKIINTAIGDSTFLILRKNLGVVRVDNQSNIETKKFELLLFHVRKNKTKNINYSLENPIPTKISEDNSNSLNIKLWYIINSDIDENTIKINNDDYYLCENDIIKFGNIKYIVKKLQINTNDNTNTNKSEEETMISDNYNINSLNKDYVINLESSQQLKDFYETLNEGNNIICYICRKYECSQDNPMIKFCDCNFFHYKCLKNKINKKTNVIDKGKVKNYCIKLYRCNDCKSVYPLRFKIDTKVFELFTIDDTLEKDYLILESIEHKIYYGYMKLIHIIKLDENTIKIGRCSEKNDIIIPDPSISREHAYLKFNKEKILIKNVSKKYGSLVLIKKSLKINHNMIQIQIGKINIEAKIMKYGEFEKMKNKNTKNPLPKKD